MELDAITEKYGLDFSDVENTETLSGYIQKMNLFLNKKRVIIGNYGLIF